MVELTINGRPLELYPTETIKYTIQNSDFFDLAGVKASYTNGFRIPKSPRNTEELQGLGLVGDTSQAPYVKTSANLKYYGFDIIVGAWLDVKETAEDYSVNLIDGVIDFFKDIEGKKIGEDLDLSALDHQKNVSTIIASFTNQAYRYILGDYGGKTLTNSGKLNADFLIPSVRVKYLTDSVFSTFGYTYSGSIFSQSDFTDLWLSYPKALPTPGAEIATEYAQLVIPYYFARNLTLQSAGVNFFNNVPAFNVGNLVTGQVLNNKYIVAEAGNYRIDIALQGKVAAQVSSLSSIIFGYFYVQVLKNGVLVGVAASSDTAAAVSTFYFSGQPGDSISTRYFAQTSIDYGYMQLRHDVSDIRIKKTNVGAVDFEEALKDLTVKDFIKEICLRFALIPNYNTRTRAVNFYQMRDILDKSRAVDWTSRYVRRVKESYSFSSYAQTNAFRQKYNDENKDYNDGYLYTENKNLAETKDLYKSILYSADQDTVPFLGVETLPLRCFKGEVKEEGAAIEVKYSALGARFYAMKSETRVAPVQIASEILNESGSASSFPLVKLQENYFAQLVGKYYSEHPRILKDLKVHTIELSLGLADILTLDLERLYYFEQEKQFYIINKITYELGKLCEGEFIRVK